MRCYLSMVLSGLFILAHAAFSDTVYFKDGSYIEGNVKRKNASSFIIMVNDGRMIVQKSEVDRIVRGPRVAPVAKSGDSPPTELGAQEMDANLSLQERKRIQELLRDLSMGDERGRKQAREFLVDMGNESDIFEYLQTTLPYVESVGPDVMQVLTELDATRAAAVLRIQVFSPLIPSRVAALKLLGKIGGAECIPVLARGLVDEEQTVRVAAAEGIAATGEKSASHLLIQGLRGPDPRVQNACKEALSRLWSDEGAPVRFSTADEWEEFCEGRPEASNESLDWEGLRPLTSKPEDERDTSTPTIRIH